MREYRSEYRFSLEAMGCPSSRALTNVAYCTLLIVSALSRGSDHSCPVICLFQEYKAAKEEAHRFSSWLLGVKCWGMLALST